MIVFIFCLIIPLLLYFVWLRYHKFGLRGRLGYTGPENQNFFFGDLPKMSKSVVPEKEQHLLLSRWLKTYGPVFGFIPKPFAGQQGSTVDMSLGFLKGKQWKHTRNAMTPAFTSKKMRLMSEGVREKTAIAIGKFREKSKKGETFNIHRDWQCLTLDVIARIAFALQTKCQTDENDRFLNNCERFMELSSFDQEATPFTVASIALPELDRILSLFRPFSNIGKCESDLANDLRDVVRQRRAAKDYGGSDMLQILIDQADDGSKSADMKLDEDQIVAQAMIIILAGYETTSTALGYTSWLLAKHPSVQEKLRNEIDQQVGEKLVDHDIALSLPYLDAVFHEALRIYPPVPTFVERSCGVACEINGYNFAPGVQVMAPVYAIHHNPELWPEPEKFDPERFMGARTYHPMAWIPFGAGPRNCIGLRFAEMEYKMALIQTLAQFTIKLGPDSPNEIEFIQKGTLMPPERVMVRLESR